MSEMRTEPRIPEWNQADRMGKSLRESGVSAAEMAEYLDVHRNTISGYVRGLHKPTRSVLIVWALRTGVPLEWLLTGQQSATRPANTSESSSKSRSRITVEYSRLDAFVARRAGAAA